MGTDQSSRPDDTAQPAPQPAIAQAATADAQPPIDPALADLRAILTGPEQRRLAQVEAALAALDDRTQDRDALIAAITPVLGEVIRRKVREDRDELIEALYPIIGQLIARAVAEAIRDLARVIDSRMQASFTPAQAWRRLRGRVSGVPRDALALRDALPFRVSRVFLIHRESGLLLLHLTADPASDTDPEIISGMLTAIRDFVADAFGRGQEGQLDEIQYGNRRIVIEASRHAYLAAVIEGVEAAGFRAAMRERIISIENTFTESLVSYDGDAARFQIARPILAPLLDIHESGRALPGYSVSKRQKWIVVGLIVTLLLCLLATCAGGTWAMRSITRQPSQTIWVVVTATPDPLAPAAHTAAPTPGPALPTATAMPPPTATAMPPPTATAMPPPTATVMPLPTATVMPLPTATATSPPATTATPRPTATPTTEPTAGTNPVARVRLDGTNIRRAPDVAADVLTQVDAGQTFIIIGSDPVKGWWRICCVQGDRTGWIAAALVTVEGDTRAVPVVDAESQ